MSKTFLSDSPVKGISNMFTLVRAGIADARAMANGELSDAEIKDYALTLLTQFSFSNSYEGRDQLFWSVADPKGMPSDARVDFIYNPTYIASSIVMYTVLKDESLLDNELVKEKLSLALNACTGRGFTGHGYDSNSGFLYSMEIFSILSTKEFVEKYPDYNEHFSKEFNEAVKYLHVLAESTKEELGWYSCDFDKAKELDEYYRNTEI